MSLAVEIDRLSYHYSNRKALSEVRLSCPQGELLGILGPNGSGKSTLFGILSTLLFPQTGRTTIFGFDLAKEAKNVRQLLGIVFQSPGLDKKLTVSENLRHHGHLYGLFGRKLESRMQCLIEQLSIADRVADRIETLSGGLKRRVELAKGLLNSPKLLLLDEPTSGLDPAARKEFWNVVREIKETEKTTVLFTTHLIDEAEMSDQLTILNGGAVVANGLPSDLKKKISTEIISVIASGAEKLASEIRVRYNIGVDVVGSNLRIECDNGARILGDILSEFDDQIDSITKSKSTLEDVFFQKTGNKFSNTL